MADPTPEELAALRPEPKPTFTEKEVFEAKIKELQEENSALRLENEELKRPKPEPKKKTFNERFNPLS